MLNIASGGGAVALGEVGSFNNEEQTLSIAHEGSTSLSLASDVEKVIISPSGDNGAFVGVPVKTMDSVTVCNLTGINGKYKMLISSAATVEPSHSEWVEGGSKLLAKLHVTLAPSEYVHEMITKGFDHHLLIKEGNYTNVMKNVCCLFGVEIVLI
jgi:L-arabinose isomerase